MDLLISEDVFVPLPVHALPLVTDIFVCDGDCVSLAEFVPLSLPGDGQGARQARGTAA